MDLIRDFKDPGREYSVLAFWFLNGELKKERLAWQIGQMVEKGVYGGFMHPRAYLKTPYLEDEWWDAVGVCVEESRKQGFAPWLYDEYAWPSGTAGSTFEYGFQKPSRILSRGRDNMAKGLWAVKKDAGNRDCGNEGAGNEGGGSQGGGSQGGGNQGAANPDAANPEDKGQSGANPSSMPYRVVKRDGFIYEFYEKVFEKAVDYLNPETIASFIKLTHEEYRKRWGEDFGKLIPGIFFDEIYMTGNPLPWTDRLPGRFRETYGYDILDELPSLVDGASERDKQVRKDYFSLVTAMYEEAFFRQISDWCGKYGLKLTGHTEEFLWEHPRRQGDYFKTMRHLMVPGSDCHDYRYRYPRRITYCEPKYSVSVARIYGKERAMSEALGGAGWNCTMEEFKKGINTLAAMGTGMFILHGFYYECDHQGSQSDWPTSFFYQNPYWDYFKIFADYIRRLSFMNSQGNPVVDYAILYPIGDMDENMENGEENPAGQAINNGFHQALNCMIEHQLDTDMVDEESILNAHICDGKLCLGQQRFKVLLLPEGGSLMEETVEKLEAWTKAGGSVLFYRTGLADEYRSGGDRAGGDKAGGDRAGGDRSDRNWPGGDRANGCSVNRYWDTVLRKNVHSISRIPEAAAGLAAPSASVIYGNPGDIFLNHRTAGNVDYYLVANSSDERRNLVLSFSHASTPVLLDIEKGDMVQAVYTQAGTAQMCGGRPSGSGVLIYMDLEPGEAVYVLFGLEEDTIRQAKPALTGDIRWEEEWITGKWDFLPLSPSGPNHGDKAYNEESTVLEIPIAEFTSDVTSGTETIRICNQSGEEGSCGRHMSLWNGRWITRRRSWNDQLDASDLYFRKTVFLEHVPEKAEFCAAAVDSFECFINGTMVYKGISNGEPVVFGDKGQLTQGENILAFHVTNRNPLHDVYVCSAEELPPDRFISLLMEGTIVQGTNVEVVKSDSTWIVNDSLIKGWEQPDSDGRFTAAGFDVRKVLNFNYTGLEHVWLKAWERGKPPLKPWGDLPLFGQTLTYPRKLWYTVTIPAGASVIYEPVTAGAAVCMLDGKEVHWENGVHILPDNERIHILTIQITADGCSDGLKQPIRVTMKAVAVNLSDWRMLGLPWFSGRCRYTNTWSVEQLEGTYMLELGGVNHCAQIWINGRLADTRLWRPYRADITSLLRPGENEITILVSNLASNERRHMLVDEGMALGWNRYWNEDNMDRDSRNYVSGLLGPVRLLHVITPKP